MSTPIPVEPESIGFVDESGVYHGFFVKEGFDAYLLGETERESLNSIIDRYDSIDAWVDDEGESGGYENAKSLLNQSPLDAEEPHLGRVSLTGGSPFWSESSSGLPVIGVWIVEPLDDEILEVVDADPIHAEEILLSEYGKGTRVGHYYFSYMRRI